MGYVHDILYIPYMCPIYTYPPIVPSVYMMLAVDDLDLTDSSESDTSSSSILTLEAGIDAVLALIVLCENVRVCIHRCNHQR